MKKQRKEIYMNLRKLLVNSDIITERFNNPDLKTIINANNEKKNKLKTYDIKKNKPQLQEYVQEIIERFL